ATDSAGAGQWRGGYGVETVFEVNADNTQLSIFGDGKYEAAAGKGLLGGTDGGLNSIKIQYPDGKVYDSEVKDLISDIPAGTTYTQVAGGGGSYGNSKERDKEAVMEELNAVLISPEFAKEHYVVESKTFEDNLH